MADTNAEVVITARYDDQASAGIVRLKDEIDSLGPGAMQIASYEASLAQSAESLLSFRDQYSNIMGDLADITRNALENYIAGSYMAVTRAMAMWIAGAKGGAKEFAKAMLLLSAQAILAVGQQAAVKSLFALAEFFLFKDPMSLVAAKLYGAVAGVAMVTGAAMMAASGQYGSGGSLGGGGGEGRSGGGGRRRADRDREPAQPTVNVYVQGHVVDSQAFVEEIVAPALADAVGRGVRSSARYNLVSRRD